MQIFFIAMLLFFSSYGSTCLSVTSNFYDDCLLFLDDAQTKNDLAIVSKFQPNSLLRSWYRWGEPSQNKAYHRRKNFVAELKKQGVQLGGGGSLSIVNENDFASIEFDRSWLTVNLDGTVFSAGDQEYAALSAPGFRHYLVHKMVEQAELGVKELHFGETNGEIRYDDWSLGFTTWVATKYENKPLSWWKTRFGTLGAAIKQKKTVTRKMFLEFTKKQKVNFQNDWGKPGSWHGENEAGAKAFLADLYRHNLDAFLKELRTELTTNGLSNVVVDIWGTAEWIARLSNKPDFIMNGPPEEHWGINWGTDPTFPIDDYRDRRKEIMESDLTTFGSIIYMIDHPKPFYKSFSKMSDERQAFLTSFLASLSREVGAKFAIRSYSEFPERLGPITETVIQNLCLQDPTRVRSR